MSRNLVGTMRGGLRRPPLLLASGLVVGLALIADVSGRRVADGYTLDVTLPGWPLLIAASALGVLWLARRWRARSAARRDAGNGGPIATAAPEPSGVVETAEPGENGAVASRNGARADGVPVARIAVRSPRAITLVAVEEISHIEAAGRYARVHAAGRQHLAQHSLAELERMLDGARFVRVHRSAIVNLERIRSLRTVDYRDFELVLDDGAAVRLSRNYRARLEAALGLRL